MTPQRRFVILDRDGTIVVERHYLAEPSQVELINGAADALRELSEMGFGLVVVTNQSGIGRGYFDERMLDLIHHRLHELLRRKGVRLDGVYHCPHRPEEDCSCRKPRTGLVELAARELDFDPESSFVIGDKLCDVELGRRVGARTFLVRTGYGAQATADTIASADYVVDTIWGAAEAIRTLVAKEGAGNGR